MRQNLNLNRLVYFSAVVEAGTFSGGASRLGITKAVVSQQIAKLEEETATSLFLRNSRKISLTEAGRRLHERCLLILGEAEDAFSELTAGSSTPRGTLRIAAPFDYGVELLTPVLLEFRAAHPECAVELYVSDKRLDLLAEGLDLTIRVGWLKDSSLLARRVGAFRQLMVAAPELIAQYGEPAEPADLVRLPFVANLALAAPGDWTFRHRERSPVELRLQAALSFDATLAAREAVRRGGGISVLPDFTVWDDVAAGRLVPLLPNWDLPEGGIFLVFPPIKHRPAKVKAFVELMLTRQNARATAASKQR